MRVILLDGGISLKVAIYIRVSTEEQASEGYSIEAQRDRLSAFAHSQDWIIHEIYADEGFSAKDTGRPALQRLLSDVEAKKIDVVLVYRLDRLTRSVLDLYQLLELFDKNNVKFKSASEVYDTTTAIGRLFITLVAALAQWERENLAERVKMGMETKALKGERNGAVAPFGYDLEDGQLIINPMEAMTVKRIFSMYTNNKGIKAIVSTLNREKVPKRGAEWAYGSVYYILNNPVYYGKIRWNYRTDDGALTGKEMLVDGTHEPIITEEEFMLAQSVRKDRKKEGKRSTSEFVFTGILTCSRCGNAMIGGSRVTANGRRKFYRCMGRFHKGICNMPIIDETSLTNILMEYLVANVDQDVEKALVIPEVAASADASLLRQQLEQELETLKRRKKKMQEAFFNELITQEELKEHTQADKNREVYLIQQLDELPAIENRSQFDKDEFINRLRSLSDVWDSLDVSTQKQTIKALFESITVDADETDYKPGPGSIMPILIKSVDLHI